MTRKTSDDPAAARVRNPAPARRRRTAADATTSVTHPWLPSPEELARWRRVLIHTRGLGEDCTPEFVRLWRRKGAWVEGRDLTHASDAEIIRVWTHGKMCREIRYKSGWQVLVELGPELGEMLGRALEGLEWDDWDGSDYARVIRLHWAKAAASTG